MPWKRHLNVCAVWAAPFAAWGCKPEFTNSSGFKKEFDQQNFRVILNLSTIKDENN
jgi:hypothetical protein